MAVTPDGQRDGDKEEQRERERERERETGGLISDFRTFRVTDLSLVLSTTRLSRKQTQLLSDAFLSHSSAVPSALDYPS